MKFSSNILGWGGSFGMLLDKFWLLEREEVVNYCLHTACHITGHCGELPLWDWRCVWLLHRARASNQNSVVVSYFKCYSFTFNFEIVYKFNSFAGGRATVTLKYWESWGSVLPHALRKPSPASQHNNCLADTAPSCVWFRSRLRSVSRASTGKAGDHGWWWRWKIRGLQSACCQQRRGQLLQEIHQHQHQM